MILQSLIRRTRGKNDMGMVKDEARKILDKVPDDATWDDIMYEFYVRQKIEASLEAETAGDVIGHEEVQNRF